MKISEKTKGLSYPCRTEDFLSHRKVAEEAKTNKKIMLT